MTKAKKHILFRLNSLRGGGAEKVLITLLKNLDYKKYDVEILLTRKGYVLDSSVPEKVKINHVFRGGSLLGNGLFDTIYKLYREIGYTITGLFPEIVYRIKKIPNYDVEIAFLEEMIPFIGRSLNKQSRKIGWVHSDLESIKTIPLKRKKRICRYLVKMDSIIVVSNQAAEALKRTCESFNIDISEFESKIKIVYNPIDINEIQKLSGETINITKPVNIPVLIGVGSLSRNKGFERLIQVHKRLLDSGIENELWIAGTGSMEKELISLIDQLGVSNSARLLGYIKNPFPYVKQADIYVLSSHNEGFSLVLTEAMAVDIPIISTRITGATEVLNNGEFGMLVENSADGLYDGIKSMLNDEAVREEYQNRSALGKKQFNLNKSINEIEQIIDLKN